MEAASEELRAALEQVRGAQLRAPCHAPRIPVQEPEEVGSFLPEPGPSLLFGRQAPGVVAPRGNPRQAPSEPGEVQPPEREAAVEKVLEAA